MRGILAVLILLAIIGIVAFLARGRGAADRTAGHHPASAMPQAGAPQRVLAITGDETTPALKAPLDAPALGAAAGESVPADGAAEAAARDGAAESGGDAVAEERVFRLDTIPADTVAPKAQTPAGGE